MYLLLRIIIIFIILRYGMLGSIDSNTGSPDLGWDTDQFPMEIKNTTLIMKVKPVYTTGLHCYIQ